VTKTKQTAAPADPAANGKAKTPCPVTAEQFLAKAPAILAVTIAGQPIAADRKQFSTGSLGWYGQGKIVVEIDGVPVKVQVGLNLTVVGSKEAER